MVCWAVRACGDEWVPSVFTPQVWAQDSAEKGAGSQSFYTASELMRHVNVAGLNESPFAAAHAKQGAAAGTHSLKQAAEVPWHTGPRTASGGAYGEDPC